MAPAADGVDIGASPFYFDESNILRHYQTDITVDTQSVVDGGLGPELLDFVGKAVEERLTDKYGMVVQSIPSRDAAVRCDFFTSSNVSSAETILVIVQNGKKQMPGVWSRGLCISHGLEFGSVLPFVDAGHKAGIAVVVLNANTNYLLATHLGQPQEPAAKVAIEGSSTPEEHISTVWERVLKPSAARNLCFLTYDAGAVRR
jgi:hypothetical protein